jgi:PAT family beta-lactamase induction signal transducer AmpG
MPLFIIYSTIAAWLKDADIDIAIITSFAATRIFYSLKFLWSPLIDQVRVPFIWHIGHRKSWMCLMFVMILSIIFCYSLLDPAKSIGYIYLLTILLGFFSATLDIVIDAFRIDIIEKDRLSVAAANAVLGYRIGGMVASAGAFYIAADYGWRYAFSVISFLYIVGILFIFTLKEPKIERKNFSFFNLKSWKIATIEPFVDFFKRDYSFIILSAVIFYKLGDAMLGVVAMPFYKELGFTLKEIAGIIKIFGLAATITGSYIG